MKKVCKSGFTIVELVIVIAVIAILAAILIPTFSGIIEKGHHSSALSEARSAVTQIAGSLGTGSVPDDTVFAVTKSGTTYYWRYQSGELTELTATDIDFSEAVDILVSSSLSAGETEALLQSTFGDSELTVSTGLNAKTVTYNSSNKSLYAAADIGASLSVLFFEKTGLTGGGANYIRVDADGNQSDDGDYILFGSYPQSQVTDEALIAKLNAKAGTLPTSENTQKFTSYRYYINGEQSDFMWYIDVQQGSDCYRGVYLEDYRPSEIVYPSGYNYQESTFETKKLYWYLYEPLQWRILTESDEKAFLFCEKLIDAQPYQNCGESEEDGKNYITGTNYLANNYAQSSIRQWLNSTFYLTAFSESQQTKIETTVVDNSAKSAFSSGEYSSQSVLSICENTSDKIFLLSLEESTNSGFGFGTASAEDSLRVKEATAYAKSQGQTGEAYWLRSPITDGTMYYQTYLAAGVTNTGKANTMGRVGLTYASVVPAMWISLE